MDQLDEFLPLSWRQPGEKGERGGRQILLEGVPLRLRPIEELHDGVDRW